MAGLYTEEEALRIRHENYEKTQAFNEWQSMMLAQAREQFIPHKGTFELTPFCSMKCKMCYMRLDPDQAKKQGRLLPRGFVLFSPWTDMTFTGKSHEVKQNVDPVLTPDYLERARSAYVGNCGLPYADDRLSPLFGDFAGFPPVYIQAGGNEMLLSDSVNLAKKLVKSNVSCKIDVYRGMWHVFQMSPFKTAYDAMDKIAEFIFDICR